MILNSCFGLVFLFIRSKFITFAVVSLVTGSDGIPYHQHWNFNRVNFGNYTRLISYSLEKLNVQSLITCCVHCSINTTCVSVVFDLEFRQCFLLPKAISLDASGKSILPPHIQALTKRKLIPRVIYHNYISIASS